MATEVQHSVVQQSRAQHSFRQLQRRKLLHHTITVMKLLAVIDDLDAKLFE